MSADDRTTTAELRTRVAELQRNIEGLLRSVATVAQDKVHEVREAAMDFCDEQRAKSQGFERTIEKCIADRPIATIITAAGAGFLVGMLWRR